MARRFAAPALILLVSSTLALTPSHATASTRPAAIADLEAGTLSDTEIRLAWTAVGSDSLTGTAFRYDIRYSDSPITEATWNQAFPVPDDQSPLPSGTLESIVVPNLSPGSDYYFGVKVADSGLNWSRLSNVAMGTTLSPLPPPPQAPDTDPPAAVTDLRAVSATDSSITLVWTEVGDDGRAGNASVIDLRWSASPITEQNRGAATPIPLSMGPRYSGLADTARVLGLAPHTTYYFALRVGDEVPNWSPISDVACDSTSRAPDHAPPVTPDGVSASWSGQAVTIRWNANPDADVVDYQVRRRIAGATSSSIVADLVAGLSWNDRSVFRGVGYYWCVVARDASGNLSMPSAETNLVVPSRPDSAGILLRASPNPTAGQVSLVFSLPTDQQVRLQVIDVTGRQVGPVLSRAGAAGRNLWPVDLAALGLARPGLLYLRLQGNAGERTVSLLLSPAR